MPTLQYDMSEAEEKKQREAAEKARRAAAEKEKGNGKWECEVDGGKWVAFDDHICKTLEDAWRKREASAAFSRSGIAYVADFDAMMQKRNDGQYTTTRTIRRQGGGGGGGGGGVPGVRRQKSIVWSKPPVHVSDGVVRHECHEGDKEQRVTKENEHLNMALGHYTRLMKGQTRGHITQVDYYESLATREAYGRTQEQFHREGKDEEIWVFHGTGKVDNAVKILSRGFKVGGVDDGVPIANGDVHGRGVYAADGPRTPSDYAGGQGKVILARALPGRKQEGAVRQKPDGSLDSWRPRDDWIVFKSGAQLLPVYILHLS